MNINGGYINSFKEEIIEIYESRNVLRSLVIKNLLGRYKNSVFGFLWHFITPFLMMVIYCIVFTQIRISTIPFFWVFITSALFPFIFMTSNLTSGAGCIISNSSLVKKMYVPKEILVLSQIITTLIILVIGYITVLTITAIVGNGVAISWTMIPIVIVIMVVFVTGYVYLFSALTVYIRDVQYFLNAISMVYYFLTPMYFLSDSVSGVLGTIIWFNPLTYFVECFHDIVYYGRFPHSEYLMMCVILSVISIVLGKFVFSKLKKGFVERL